MPLRLLRNLIISLALVVFGAGLGYQYRDWVEAERWSLKQKQAPAMTREDMDFSLFWSVWETLQMSYLNPEELDAQEMMYGAIRGMTASLGDPYTVFLPPPDNKQVKEDLNGEFDGVGIQLGYKRDTIAVMAPLEDHPAIKQGVKAGDLILNIKDEEKGIDKDTVGMTLPEAVQLIRGKKGTPVILTLYREEKGQFELTIVRDTIVIPSVELTIGDFGENEEFEADDEGRVAWVRVYRFGENTQNQWDQAVSEINAKRGRLDGIVLDVRNNPGGYLQGAISLASDFVPQGKVVEQSGRYESEVYEVTRRGRLIGMPVVIIINGGSASASEILAGAMRDRLGTVLVGERSFGKGTVQEALDLPGEAGLHVTTSRWLLPSGEWIHDDGLAPDFEVTLADVAEATEAAKLVDEQLKEAIRLLREVE